MHDRDVGRVGTVGDGARHLAAGDEGGDRAGAHRLSALVDDEAAVGVTVEREPEVGAVRHDGGLEVAQVLGLEGVRLVVREGAVELEVQRLDLDGQRRQAGVRAEHRRDGEPAHPVARVDDDAQRPDAREVDEPPEEAGVVGEDVALGERPLGPVGVRDLTGEDALGEHADVGEAGVLPDGPGTAAAQLDPVVLRRVVARGEHRPRAVERPARVVEAVGAAQPDEDDVPPAAAHPLGEGRDERRPAVAHVVAHDARRRVVRGEDDLGEGGPEGARDLRVELVGDGSAHVVGLDDVAEGSRAHGARAYASTPRRTAAGEVTPRGGWGRRRAWRSTTSCPRAASPRRS